MRVLLITGLFVGSAWLLAQNAPPKVKAGPMPATPAGAGKAMFDSYCASCHGLGAKGDGPAAPAMVRQPADLTMLARNNAGKYPATKVIMTLTDSSLVSHGSKDMPVWGPLLTTVSREDPGMAALRAKNISNYIETLQAK